MQEDHARPPMTDRCGHVHKDSEVLLQALFQAPTDLAVADLPVQMVLRGIRAEACGIARAQCSRS